MLKARYRENLKWVHISIGIFFSKFGISPNTWTALSLVPAVAGFLALYSGSLSAALILFVISAFIDIIDGNVARVTKSVSNIGAFMDGVMDRLVEFILYLGLWFYLKGSQTIILESDLWILLLVFGAMMPSFITAYADHKNVIGDEKKLKNLGGLIERFERLLILYLGMLAGISDVLYLQYFIIITVILTYLTTLQRIFTVVRNS